jgi:hypothetical protein
LLYIDPLRLGCWMSRRISLDLAHGDQAIFRLICRGARCELWLSLLSSCLGFSLWALHLPHLTAFDLAHGLTLARQSSLSGFWGGLTHNKRLPGFCCVFRIRKWHPLAIALLPAFLNRISSADPDRLGQ